MNKYLYIGISACIIFFTGFFVARQKTPVKTITVEKEVVKVQTDIKTVIKRVKSPDGTVITEVIKEDKSKSESDKFKTVETNNQKQWRASIYTTLKTDQYGLSIERRIVGPFFVGGWISTEKTGGVSVGIEF